MTADFLRAITQGVQHCQQVLGEEFIYAGEVYKGVFSSAQVDVSMMVAGQNASAQCVLKALRSQFVTVPKERETIEWRDETWFLLQDAQPNDAVSVSFVIVRRQK